MTRLRQILRDPVWVDAIVPTALMRVVLLGFAVAAVIIVRPDFLPQEPLLGVWNRWDAPRILEIVRNGYGPPTEPAGITVFPGMPLLIIAGSRFVDPLLAGMLISFVASLVAAVGLYRLVRLDDTRGTARLAVIAMCLFPTAFAFVAPYSEATFLAFAIWSFVCARRDDWRGAGILALLASLTRIQGIFLLPALAIEYWLARRRVDRDAAWIALIALGPLVYLGLNQAVFGDPLAFLPIQQEVFNNDTVPPWEAMGTLLGHVLAVEPTERWLTVHLAPLLAIVVLSGAFIWTLVGKGTRPAYAVYTGITLLSVLVLSWPISVPRYILGAFPMFIAIGRLIRRPWLRPPILLASALGLAMCLTLFVTGQWAF